jgi:hypothetical protein
MGLPNSQLQILAEIEQELQADQGLADQFSDFTSVTLRAGLPAAERLGAPNSRTGWRNSGRPGLLSSHSRLVMTFLGIVAGLLITLVTLSVTMSGDGRNRCEPVNPAFHVSYTMPCVPPGSGGHLYVPGSSSGDGHV